MIRRPPRSTLFPYNDALPISALEDRTEGWIAGLQLAALSMRGREDVSGFIRAFAGDNRYIVDYLVEEVLQRQPERIRSFLLQTSILDRKSTRLNSSHANISYAVFCLKKKKIGR